MYKRQPEEAAALGADYYLALHDNAYDGAHCGAQAFYHPDSPRSKALATALAERLNAVCTLPITFPNPVRDGMQAFDGAGYGEIREPYRRGVIPVILEVNFHDYEMCIRDRCHTRAGLRPARRRSRRNADTCGRSGYKRTPDRRGRRDDRLRSIR